MGGLTDFMSTLKTMGGQVKEDMPSMDAQSMQAWFQDFFTLSNLVTVAINLLLIAVLFYAVKWGLTELAEKRKLMRLQGKIKVKKKTANPMLRIGVFNRMYESLKHRARQKGDEEKADKIFLYLILGFFVLTGMFIVFKQYFLAIGIPLFLAKFTADILESLEISDEEYVTIQLPKAIDNILKAATRYGDTKTILFEAARTLPHPIKGEFDSMVRKMNSQDNISVLNDFREKYNSIWVRSFVFILVSMNDDSERETAMENLKNLRVMLEADNNMRISAVTNKKISVNTNYALAGVASAVGIGAILFTEVGREFYFTTPMGLICFIGGFALVLATIKMNIRMSSTKEK